MNATVIEGAYVNWETVYPQFLKDYIYSTELTNNEIKNKYDLSISEFKDLADYAKKDCGLSRRPVAQNDGRYYYKQGDSWIICKFMNSVLVYFGRVPEEWIAIQIVEICKNECWNVDKCKNIVQNWKDYIV